MNYLDPTDLTDSSGTVEADATTLCVGNEYAWVSAMQEHMNQEREIIRVHRKNRALHRIAKQPFYDTLELALEYYPNGIEV